MANNNSNVSNPFVQNIERPFSELFELLLQFKKDAQPEILQAIEVHSKNAVYLLTTGMQSLGVLLATAVEQDGIKIAKRDISNIGWLVVGLSDLLGSCILMREEVSSN